MANFNTTGIEGLALSLEEVADLPEDILLRMLTAQGAVIARAQKQKIAQLGLVDSKQLKDSITVDKKLRSDGRYMGTTTRYINVYPQGVRKKRDGSTQRTGHTYKKRRGGKLRSVHDTTNAEVAFVLEFGAPGRGIAPTQWMREANAGCAAEAERAALDVYDAWMKSKGL